jgi:hypothetical protein
MNLFDVLNEDTSSDQLQHDVIDQFKSYFVRKDYDWRMRFYSTHKHIISQRIMLFVLNVYEDDIAEYVEATMSVSNYSNYDSIFQLLCKFQRYGVHWPWIQKILEGYKTKFIKSILIIIRENDYEDAQEIINDATEAKLNWPEIVIIKKSLDTVR